VGPGKDVFGWPTGDVRLSVAWDGGALARPHGQASPAASSRRAQ
jgi:hypothetical protein